MTAAPKDRGPLDRGTITTRAVAFADEWGVDSLSMRKLAAELGYEVMSLYNHVANKDDVLALMADAVAAEIPAPDPGDEPLVAVRTLAVDTRAALVRHPWAASLWLRQLPGPARVQHMEHHLAILAATDMSPSVAHLAYHAVNNHVLGYTLQEQAMAYALPPDGDADALARSFLAGIARRGPPPHRRARPATPRRRHRQQLRARARPHPRRSHTARLTAHGPPPAIAPRRSYSGPTQTVGNWPTALEGRSVATRRPSATMAARYSSQSGWGPPLTAS